MLGDRLRWLRNRAELSQADVAEQVGMSESQVLRWENNKAEPDAKSLRKLANMFGVTADYLLGLADDPRGNMAIELSTVEWELIKAYRESDLVSFTLMLAEKLKERS